jgi:hypothetical protein
MEAELGDELVALDPNAGECFGFNNVAASVWRQLAAPQTLDQLVEALLAEYDVQPEQCATEIGHLLDDLAAKGLVTKSA